MFGVNAVTRSLEKRDTSLVLVDGGAQPPIITKHLVELCMINRVPGAQIQQLSSIGDVVGLRSVTCLAFKPLVSVCASRYNGILDVAGIPLCKIYCWTM